MAKKIYHLYHKESETNWHYTSIKAACNHEENPLSLTRQHWGVVAKKEGYPFERSGCVINQVKALGYKDVKGHTSTGG